MVALIGSRGEFGGPTTVALGLAGELASRGRQVAVVSQSVGPVARPTGLPPSAWRVLPAVRLVPRSGMLGLLNPRLVLTLWRSLGPGVVAHVHAGRDLMSLTALTVARMRRTPVVAQTHGMVRPRTAWTARAFDAVFLRLLGDARKVLYLTEGEREDLTRLVGAARLTFVANGVVVPDVPEVTGDVRGVPRVVFASRLHPVKGVLTFARAARLLLAEGVVAEFVVYGPDQGDLAGLLELVADTPGPGRLSYAGALDHHAMAAAIGDADVFVLPSLVDWMPMALLEALAAGVATVSSSTCGLAPAIEADDAGLVVDPDVDAVASAVRSLLTDAPLRAQLGGRARSLVTRSFSVQAVVDDLETIYAAVVADDDRPGSIS